MDAPWMEPPATYAVDASEEGRPLSEPSDSESIFKGLIAFVQRPQAVACGRL